MAIIPFRPRPKKALYCASCRVPMSGSPPQHRLCRRCFAFEDYSRAVHANLPFLRGGDDAA